MLNAHHAPIEQAPAPAVYDPENRAHRSLLLYLECRAVDNRGRINPVQMNDDDRHILLAWLDAGFMSGNSVEVMLSDAAWKMAAQERRARAERMHV